jgi:hypothetical protein
MYSKWIKCGFILAMLFVSMVSLSMAACPWFIKNELYTAQCGVEKVVPAIAGLLANDPSAVSVLNPEDITIDEKYGTLDVNADGSFDFNPSPDIQPGTYVTFQYGATNGACDAKYLGIAKIQVSCKCRPNVADITLCLPQTLASIRQALIDAGVGCLGCGAAPYTLDLSKIKLVPGIYDYALKCSGCNVEFGKVTLTTGCTAVAPPFSFCEGTVTFAQLQAMINSGADCAGAGCDQAPVIDTADVTVDANGFVTGGSYTATCGAGSDCSDDATGIITVTPKCVAIAPPIELCEGNSIAEVLEEIAEVVPDCTNCDATPVITTNNVTIVGGLVTGGRYTVTCGVGPCASSAEGTVTVVPRCEVEVISVIGCGTPDSIKEQVELTNQFACGDCDSAPVFTFPVFPLRADGINVANGTYLFTVTCSALPEEDCDSSDTGEIVVACPGGPCPCEATALPIEVCPGKVTRAALIAMILDGNATCDSDGTGDCDVSPVIDTTGVTFANGFVTGGTYTAICQPNPDCLAKTATATVTVVDRPYCGPCKCKAYAPNLCFSTKCGSYSYAEILKEVKAKGGNCGSNNCDMALELPTDLQFSFAHEYKYKVVCTKGDCNDEAEGNLLVREKGCTGCVPHIQ